MITKDEIDRAYTNCINARADLRVAETGYYAVKSALENAKAKRLLAGEITGKNVEEREAKAIELLGSLYEDVERFENEVRVMRSGYDITRLEVDRAMAILKLLEITSLAQA